MPGETYGIQAGRDAMTPKTEQYYKDRLEAAAEAHAGLIRIIAGLRKELDKRDV